MNIGTIRANDRGALTGSIATLTVAMSFALRGVAAGDQRLSSGRRQLQCRVAAPPAPLRLSRGGLGQR